MKFTRKEILATIKNEPLKKGYFIYTEDMAAVNAGNMTYEEVKLKQDKCPACVVGNLLRSKLGKKMDGMPAFEFDDKCYEATYGEFIEGEAALPRLLEEENYLGALSSKFERLADKYKTMKTVRKHLAEWVKKNIPTEFTVKGI